MNHIYLLRLEQFYPWPMKSVMTELQRFPNAELVWCQEEPANMGAWSHFRVRFGDTILGRPFHGVSRSASASPWRMT